MKLVDRAFLWLALILGGFLVSSLLGELVLIRVSRTAKARFRANPQGQQAKIVIVTVFSALGAFVVRFGIEPTRLPHI